MFNWMNQVFNFLAGAQYQTSPAPITPGGVGPLLCDQFGRLIVVTNAAGAAAGSTLWVDPSALAATGTIKGSAGSLYQAFGTNEGAAGWIMVFDKASAPATNDTPKLQVKVPAAGSFSFDLPRSKPFVNGIVWGVSSTAGAYNALGGAQFWVNAEYI